MSTKLILVMVEGGCVQAVTHTAEQQWDVWDWDDFKDNPEAYWAERDAETQEIIKLEWPDVYADVQEELARVAMDRYEKRRSIPFYDVPELVVAEAESDQERDRR